MKALRQLKYAEPLQVSDVPMPQAVAGTAVVQILAANIVSFAKSIYNGTLKYPYPTPLTAGSSAVGKIHELGPDNTSLEKDQLVFVDITFRSRSDPGEIVLSAFHEGYTPGSKKLMSHWRDGSYAEYMLCPLENVYPLSPSLVDPIEKGGQGYELPDLLYIPKILVPYGGLASIGVRPGETVIIAPATGGFGGAAVHMALSMGARVIALGRNKDALATLDAKLASKFPPRRLLTLPIDADATVDSLRSSITVTAGKVPIDCFFDISPQGAANAAYFKAAILSLRQSGRASLMGGTLDDVSIPHSSIMRFNLTLRGNYMFGRKDVLDVIGMVETGVLQLGDRGGVASTATKAFELEEWEQAFDHAEANTGLGTGAYFAPAASSDM